MFFWVPMWQISGVLDTPSYGHVLKIKTISKNNPVNLGRHSGRCDQEAWRPGHWGTCGGAEGVGKAEELPQKPVFKHFPRTHCHIYFLFYSLASFTQGSDIWLQPAVVVTYCCVTNCDIPNDFNQCKSATMQP